ncbi:MAG: YggT family protein [Pseudomonadota bacterium]
MRALLDVVLVVLDIAIFLLIIQAILSWLIAFNVINSRNAFVANVWQILHQVTEPFLRPIRNMLPRSNGLDLAPLVLILLIFFTQRVVAYYIYPNVI